MNICREEEKRRKTHPFMSAANKLVVAPENSTIAFPFLGISGKTR